jgi:ATP-binding protein involved in chromosome partitioning
MAVTEEAVLAALKTVKDPELFADVVSLGMIKDIAICDSTVKFTFELTTAACPVKAELEKAAEDAVLAVDGVETVNVNVTARVRPSRHETKSSMLPGVKNIVVVASGKGGVGKSTVSANLALALAADGCSVGLMDADVYGPSIPTMMGVPGKRAIAANAEKRIEPVPVHGIHMMSMGFFMDEAEAVVWRGPMLHGVIQQFLGQVDWGELDYLVIDLPPGTGDVQLSLCQTIPVTGAVIVSTPQDVALRVASKAIAMFKKLNAPILGVVENMSEFVCPHCGEETELFGKDGAKNAADEAGFPFLGSIPLDLRTRVAGDEGDPIVHAEPESRNAKAFMSVARNTAGQISVRAIQGAQAASTPQTSAEEKVLFSE